MSNSHVTILGFMTVRPGTEDVLQAAASDVVAKTRSEAGCVSYDLLQNAKDSTKFVFYERFIDQTAFDHHLEQPYVQTWIELAESYGATFDIGLWHGLT